MILPLASCAFSVGLIANTKRIAAKSGRQSACFFIGSSKRVSKRFVGVEMAIVGTARQTSPLRLFSEDIVREQVDTSSGKFGPFGPSRIHFRGRNNAFIVPC